MRSTPPSRSAPPESTLPALNCSKARKECTGPRKSLAKTKERAAAEADAKARATTLRAGARALLDVIDE